jgi:hypothetical protein
VSAATSLAMAAAIASQPYDFISSAMVGDVVADPSQSQLSGLLLQGENAILATEGEAGCALFSDTRLLVGHQAGILSKRLAVKSLRRDGIIAYSIDPDTHVLLELLGNFGKATLYFESSFNPMHLSQWLGQTLTGSPGRGES